MKKRNGFTLVELLAVIAILAIILLIAVPQILGVIEDARQDSFRNSVRGVFHAIELENARENTTEGNVADLDLSGQEFKTGTWKIADGVITITNIGDGTYCVASLADTAKGSEFTVTDTCGADTPVTGGNTEGA